MLRIYVKFLMFISSYIPLYIIFIIQNYSDVALDLFFGALTISVIVVLSVIYFHIKSLSNPVSFEIDRLENINNINLEYFVVYILPFLGIDILNLKTALSLLFLFSIIGFMYVKSNSIFMNPAFTVIGLNIFKLTTKGGDDLVLITSGTPKKDQSIAALKLSEDIFIVA